MSTVTLTFDHVDPALFALLTGRTCVRPRGPLDWSEPKPVNPVKHPGPIRGYSVDGYVVPTWVHDALVDHAAAGARSMAERMVPFYDYVPFTEGLTLEGQVIR